MADAEHNWKNRLLDHEKKLKSSAANSLANQEKKYLAIQAEQDAAHKKQVDELRTFHTISALAAKKVQIFQVAYELRSCLGTCFHTSLFEIVVIGSGNC